MIINYENIIEELAEIIFSVDRATAREIQYRYNEHVRKNDLTFRYLYICSYFHF